MRHAWPVALSIARPCLGMQDAGSNPPAIHMNNRTDALIRDRVDAFVNDISDLIHRAALEAVEEVLSGASSRASTAKRAAKRPAVSSKKAKARRGRPRKTEAADPAAVLKLVGAATDGARVEVMAKELGVTSAAVKPAVAELLAAKKVRRVGKARGTKYFAKY